MSEGARPSRIETRLYDADGKLTDDESTAVRGEVVELDAEGRVIARHEHGGLTWQVDPKALEGDPGELATRPKHQPR
jgi:YD repeat-containing protein